MVITKKQRNSSRKGNQRPAFGTHTSPEKTFSRMFNVYGPKPVQNPVKKTPEETLAEAGYSDAYIATVLNFTEERGIPLDSRPWRGAVSATDSLKRYPDLDPAEALTKARDEGFTYRGKGYFYFT